MTVRTELSRFVRVVSWIDGYQENFFKDPVKIDEEVEKTNSDYLKRRWKRIQDDVEKIWIPQSALSNRFNILTKTNEVILYGFSAIFLLVFVFDFQALMPIMRSLPLLVIILVSLVLLNIYRSRTQRRIEENSETYAEKLQKIRIGIQDLILHLCEIIMLEEKDPKKYEMEVCYPNYQGTYIVRAKSGFWGSKVYKAVPSIAGWIVSKAKGYVRVIDPRPTGEVLNALRIAPPELEISLLTSNEMSKDKRFRRTCIQVKNARTGKFDAAACDLGDLNNRIMIAKNKAWCAKEKEWDTITEIPSAKIRTLKESFEEKWKKASILT